MYCLLVPYCATRFVWLQVWQMVWPPLYEFGDLSTLLKKTKQDKQIFCLSSVWLFIGNDLGASNNKLEPYNNLPIYY
jgi:hypothetical protein